MGTETKEHVCTVAIVYTDYEGGCPIDAKRVQEYRDNEYWPDDIHFFKYCPECGKELPKREEAT